MIKDHVDAVAPHVTLDDVWARTKKDGATRGVASPRPRRVRGGVVVVAVALVLALVATLLMVPDGSPESSAAAALSQAASVAASRPSGPVPSVHQYLYYEMTQGGVQATPVPVGQKSILYRYTESLDTWVAPNGAGRQRITYAPDSLVLPSQRGAWDAPHAQPIGPGPSDTTFPTTFTGTHPVGGPLVTPSRSRLSYVLSYPATAKFPTQPAALERAIERYFGITKTSKGTRSIVFLAGNVLQVGASPALRAALFKMVQELPGVTLLGRTKDASGRVGVGVALTTGHLRDVLVFNPRTSAVLGELTVTLRNTSLLGTTVPKGTIVDFTTYGSAGVTSSTTRLPDGTLVPFMSDTTSSANGSSALYLGEK
jgi:hypothetical protein